MEKFKIVIKNSDVCLQKHNHHPKLIIKEGVPIQNHEYESFERKAFKKAKLILNPIKDQKDYSSDELELVWQLYNHGTEQWEDVEQPAGSNWDMFKSKHKHKDIRRAYRVVNDKSVVDIKKTIKVYVASPYTLGDVAVNVKAQMEVANKLMDLGFAPFVPLYSHFQHMAFPRPYEDWIKIDKTWVLSCDALYRFGGESKGADGEVELAKSNNIPVFFDLGSLIKHFKNE